MASRSFGSGSGRSERVSPLRLVTLAWAYGIVGCFCLAFVLGDTHIVAWLACEALDDTWALGNPFTPYWTQDPWYRGVRTREIKSTRADPNQMRDGQIDECDAKLARTRATHHRAAEISTKGHSSTPMLPVGASKPQTVPEWLHSMGRKVCCAM